MNFIEIAYASAAEVQSAQEGGILGSAASLGINYKLFLFQLVNFGVVMLVLWFLILKPLVKKLIERQSIIDQGLENSKKAQENFDLSEKDFQNRIKDAQKKSKQIITEAMSQAQKDAEDIKKRAGSDIENLSLKAKERIQEEKNKMIADFRKEAAGMVEMALEKFLSAKMDKEEDKKFIERIIK